MPRFPSAWKATGSMRWGSALESALAHSLRNVPSLPGRTLILIDVSGSMTDRVSARSEMQRWEIAGCFGFALALRAQNADTYIYNTGHAKVDTPPGASILRALTELKANVGGGTHTLQTLQATYAGHDRVVIVTDEQAHPGAFDLDQVPQLYTFNLGGYRVAHAPSGEKGRHTFGGLTDAGFSLIPTLEAREDGRWPWE